MRLVLDTNVIVSAALWGGLPRKILETAHAKHTLCFSLSTLRELERVFHYPKFENRLNELSFSIEEFTERLMESAIVIPDSQAENVIQEDPADNVFLACAAACQANLIVSGDEHLLALKKYRSIQILDPRRALQIVKDSEGEKI